MISFQNVTKTYPNGVKALDSITFRIDRGEFVFIVGPSGAGKSTLTKLLIREESPDYGKIYVNDFEVSTMKKSMVPYLRRSMGMVFQDFKLLPGKTVYDNIAFAMEVTGTPRRQIRRQIPNVLSMVE